MSTNAYHGSSPDTGTLIGPVESVVGPGIELPTFGFNGFIAIDYSDTNILVTATIDQPFGYWEMIRMSDVAQSIPAFTCITINGATNWAGFGASNITLSADYIIVTIGSLRGLKGQRISLDIHVGDLDHGASSNEVKNCIYAGKKR